MTCMQLLALQARAMDGTSPSIVTRALSTKTPNGRPRGEPCSTTMLRHCYLFFGMRPKGRSFAGPCNTPP